MDPMINLGKRLGNLLELPSLRFRLAYGAWLFGIFAYFLPAATWNPVSRFSLTRAIVEQHTLAIDAYADSTGDRARVGAHWYSDKAPLVALLAVPAYSAFHLLDRSRGKAPEYRATSTATRPAVRVTVNRSFQRALYVCSLATAGVAGVALGLLLFELLRKRVDPRTALIGSALTVLGTPLLPYATSFYGHSVAAAFLVGALVLLERTASPSSSASSARAAGACLALSVGCEYLAAVPAAVLLLVAVATAERGRRWWLLREAASGALLPAALLALYHAVCFGAPWKTGYSFVVDPEFAKGHSSGFLGVREPHLQALWGLLFGRLRGLFYIAPVAALLVLGLFAGVRDRGAAAAAAAAAALVVVNSSYYMWWGGASAGPRHLVPVLGLLALGLPWVWAAPWRRRLYCLLAGVSALNMFAITAVGLEAPERGDILVDFVYSRLAQGKVSALSGASNLGLELGLVRGGSLALLCVWLLVGGYMLWRQVRELAQPLEPLPASLAPLGARPLERTS